MRLPAAMSLRAERVVYRYTPLLVRNVLLPFSPPVGPRSTAFSPPLYCASRLARAVEFFCSVLYVRAGRYADTRAREREHGRVLHKVKSVLFLASLKSALPWRETPLECVFPTRRRGVGPRGPRPPSGYMSRAMPKERDRDWRTIGAVGGKEHRDHVPTTRKLGCFRDS